MVIILKGYMYEHDYIWVRDDGGMKPTRREPTGDGNNDCAVSEVIGAVMLISIVIVGVAIVGVVLWSQPPPQKIPALSTGISNESCKVILTHNGGNLLEEGSFKIYVDTDDRTGSFTKTGVPGPVTSWGIGETLVYNPPPPCSQTPRNVRIVYTGGNGATILSSASFEAPATLPQIYVPTVQQTITASAGAGGSISPSGAVSVNEGTDATFSITPTFGYHIADVIVDGVSQGAIASYTFTFVETDHTISASFAVTTHHITASAVTGGIITPSGDVVVNEGANQAFTITPGAGYHIVDVVVDSVSQGTVSTYTFTNVTAAHTISALFAINTYTITPSAGAGGSIAPSSPVTVVYGNSSTFTITRNLKYHIEDVTVDGSSVGAVPSYTFNNVIDNHTISATFAVNTRADIFYDGFEALRPSANGWTETGSVDWGAYTPRNGARDVRLRGAAPAESITRTISTVDNSDIVVQFAWAGQSLEAGEYIRAEYSTDGGSSWTTLSQINGVIGAGVPAFTNFVSPTLPAIADYNPSFVLRFRISANSHTNDYAYIDDVRVTGIPD
jgi:hypothetical protein